MSVFSMPCLTLFADGMIGMSDPVRPEDFGLPPEIAWQPDSCGQWPVMRVPHAATTEDLCVCLCGACSSSLDIAHQLAAAELLPVWGSVLALVQRAGRGQLGRNWHSPPGNLFAALRLPLAPPFDSSSAAPALGVLLATILRTLGHSVAVKWPNDLVLTSPDARKVGGMLLEERHGCLMAGIGLNLRHAPPAAALREGHALPGGCLYTATRPQAPCEALTLWQQLVAGLKLWYEQSPLEHVDRPGWHNAAAQLLLWQGQPVRLYDGCEERKMVRGTLVGVAPDGGLCLRIDGRIAVFYSGSLVPDAPQVLLRTSQSSSFF